MGSWHAKHDLACSQCEVIDLFLDLVLFLELELVLFLELELVLEPELDSGSPVASHDASVNSDFQHRTTSRRIEQTDKDRIDNPGLLIFLLRIDHIVFDTHRLWKVYRGKLKQSLGAPKTD